MGDKFDKTKKKKKRNYSEWWRTIKTFSTGLKRHQIEHTIRHHQRRRLEHQPIITTFVFLIYFLSCFTFFFHLRQLIVYLWNIQMENCHYFFFVSLHRRRCRCRHLAGAIPIYCWLQMLLSCRDAYRQWQYKIAKFSESQLERKKKAFFFFLYKIEHGIQSGNL